jgi:replicative DNA helicase
MGVDEAKQLAEQLKLPLWAIRRIKGIGYSPTPLHHDMNGPCFTFPEFNSAGVPVGIVARYGDGTKKALAGSKRGLTLPVKDLSETTTPIFLVEGPSDTMAMAAVGLTAIGRPSNIGGIQQLAELLSEVPSSRLIIVVGENDQKPNGDWPGRDGARQTAQRLSEQLKRPVQWALTPDGAKDVREWVAGKLNDHNANEIGQQLSSKLQATAEGGVQPEPWAFRWEAIDSKAFASRDYRPNWLVKGALVDRQPCVIGGPQKSLKTTIGVVDLGISLASATPWLGKFDVPVQRRTCIVSGESGPWTLQETARRICKARGLILQDLGNQLFWQFRLPQLSIPEQLTAMRDGLKRDEIAVAIIDPLYLSLLNGNSDLAASNLYDIGPLLLRVAETCLAVNATPILLHHTTKPSAKKLEPLDLTDLAFSGVSEFARQWVLLSRREPHEGGSGQHALWLVLGGSCGHGGHYAVNVNEGQLSDDFSGRTWEICVMPVSEARDLEKETRTNAKEEARRQRDGDDERAIIRALETLSSKNAPVPYGRIRALSGLSKDRMNSAVERLLANKRVKSATVKVTIGNGGKRPSPALRIFNGEEEK